MQAYVINLKEHTDRMTKSTNCLQKIGFKPTEIHRVDAIYGRDIKEDDRKKYTNKMGEFFLTNGALGCALSHLKAWKTFLAETDTSVTHGAFFEDDIVANRSSDTIAAIPELPDDYDMMYIGAIWDHRPENSHGEKYEWHYNKVVYGMHAYILSRHGAEKLLALLDGKLQYNIDQAMVRFVKYGCMQSAALVPSLLDQTSNNPDCSGDAEESTINGLKFPSVLNRILKSLSHNGSNQSLSSHLGSKYFRLGKSNIEVSNFVILVFLLTVVAFYLGYPFCDGYIILFGALLLSEAPKLPIEAIHSTIIAGVGAGLGSLLWLVK